MKLFRKAKDGGKDSTVTGYWLIEWKEVFSLVILKFEKGSRDAFHTHAFNAISWYIKGDVEERFIDGTSKNWKGLCLPKYTSRKCFHKVFAKKTSWVLSIRGPWVDKWKEYIPHSKKYLTLTNGRKVVEVSDKIGL